MTTNRGKQAAAGAFLKRPLTCVSRRFWTKGTEKCAGYSNGKMATVGSRGGLMLEAESVLFTALFAWPRSYPQGCHFGCCTLHVAATDWRIFFTGLQSCLIRQEDFGFLVTVLDILTPLKYSK